MFFKKEMLKMQKAISMCQKMSWWERSLAWLNRELWLKLWQKKKVYELWKKGQATQEDYKDVTRLCREKSRRVKAQLEINLATAVKDNFKSSCKHISNKRRAKENLHPLLHEGGNIVTKDEEKAEIFNAFFVSDFNGKPVVLVVPSPLSWRTETGSRMKPP